MTEQLTRAQQYLQQPAPADVEIVDITAPSGRLYAFEKPSKTKIMFRLGDLPQFLASSAVERWSEDQVLKNLESSGTDMMKMFKASIGLRDFVLSMSRSPKLVVGNADAEKDELSTDYVPDDDLLYLTRWVLSGGEAGEVPVTFPGGEPGNSTAAQPNRKNRRAKAKQAGRNS
jgi:hypothetical protein